MRSVMNSMRLFVVLLEKDLMQTSYTLICNTRQLVSITLNKYNRISMYVFVTAVVEKW